MPLRFGEPAFFEACCHALLSGIAGRAGSGMSVVAGETEGRRAVEMLRRLAANGFSYPEAARTKSGLNPLRPRSDFLLLMMDLAFPDNPFDSKPAPKPEAGNNTSPVLPLQSPLLEQDNMSRLVVEAAPPWAPRALAPMLLALPSGQE